jgi:hypothetical protein
VRAFETPKTANQAGFGLFWTCAWEDSNLRPTA